MNEKHADPRDSQFANDLLAFIDRSPTAFHAVETIEEQLRQAGFSPLSMEIPWNLVPGAKHVVIRNGSALIAFVVGSTPAPRTGFRIVGCHTDAPGFRIKPSPEMASEKGYIRLNTEVYGGPILSTWFDRPLSIAGRVMLCGPVPMVVETQLIDFKRPLCIIPNLAIHMNREVNKGVEINKQVDTLPLFTIADPSMALSVGLLRQLVAQTLGVSQERILDMELSLYDPTNGTLLGLNDEFISVGRLDDLAAVHAGMHALTSVPQPKSTTVLACFDNEEVGSSSKQGADSPFLVTTLERIALGLDLSREDFLRSVTSTFLISVDGAHAVHPGRGEKSDPTSRPMLNGGPVIKISANQRYTSDAESIAVFIQLCKEAQVDYQFFVNHSMEPGGSTIGPLSSTHLDVRALDVGSPMLSMHSIRELAGVHDHIAMRNVLTHFYGT